MQPHLVQMCRYVLNRIIQYLGGAGEVFAAFFGIAEVCNIIWVCLFDLSRVIFLVDRKQFKTRTMVASVRTMMSLFLDVHIPDTCRMLMCCLTILTVSQRKRLSIGCFLFTTYLKYCFLEIPYPINQASTAT